MAPSQQLCAIVAVVAGLVLTSAANDAIPIPFELWQTYRTSALPPAALDAQQTWARLNPGMPLRLQNDSEASAFVSRTFGREASDVYTRFPLGVMRADFWRYAILYAMGGVYSDIDTKCVTSLSTWLPPKDKGAEGLPLAKQYDESTTWKSCSIVIGLENDDNFCQWTIASVAGHPILRAAIKMILWRAKDGVDPKKDTHFVHAHTGPGIWTDAIKTFLQAETSIASSPHMVGDKKGSAKDMFMAIHSNATLYDQVRRLGVCLLGSKFIAGPTDKGGSINVINLYGSQKALDKGFRGWDGYTSWLSERKEIRGAKDVWSRRMRGAS